MYRWICLHARDRDTDVKNGHVGTEGEVRPERNWESKIDTYIL